jgi:putative ABC transport system permease protein
MELIQRVDRAGLIGRSPTLYRLGLRRVKPRRRQVTVSFKPGSYRLSIQRIPAPPVALPRNGRSAALPAVAYRPAPRRRARGLSPWGAITIALEGLRRSKTRSLLAMLGIIIGVGSVIAMMGLGEGTRLEMEAQIRRLGTNTLSIRAAERRLNGVSLGRNSGQRLTLEDATAIDRLCPAVAQTSARVTEDAQVRYRNKNERAEVMGVTPEYFVIRNFPLEAGRYFGAAELAGRARVCLLGPEIQEDLFGKEDAIGKRIYLKGQPYRVIGLLQARGGNDSDFDERVWLPVTTAMERVFNLKYISRIEVQARDEKSLDLAQSQIEALLRMRHRVGAGDESTVEIRNQKDLLDTASESSAVLTALLAGIASVSLLVGGIGIMNIMLVSVVERTREIGIRRAVGARRADILVQFIIEALVMCAMGAVLGVVVGIGLCWVGAVYAGWPTVFTPLSVWVSSGFAIAIGLFFGLYPAYRAAVLSPLDALRHE